MILTNQTDYWNTSSVRKAWVMYDLKCSNLHINLSKGFFYHITQKRSKAVRKSQECVKLSYPTLYIWLYDTYNTSWSKKRDCIIWTGHVPFSHVNQHPVSKAVIDIRMGLRGSWIWWLFSFIRTSAHLLGLEAPWILTKKSPICHVIWSPSWAGRVQHASSFLCQLTRFQIVPSAAQISPSLICLRLRVKIAEHTTSKSNGVLHCVPMWPTQSLDRWPAYSFTPFLKWCAWSDVTLLSSLPFFFFFFFYV